MNRSCKPVALRSILLPLLFAASTASAATTAGFHAERLGSTIGFATSLAIASDGTVYYSTTSGDIARFANGESLIVAHVPTEAAGDAGLLGIALVDDHTAVVHYTTPRQTYEVIARVDLVTGAIATLHEFVCDASLPGRSVSAEHHGGNPIVADDGSVYVGIGDFGGGLIASLPGWDAGKILRIDPDGTATQIARGFRNPFDMAWDAEKQRLIVGDNGTLADDEINIVDVASGGYYGWPFTAGNGAPVEGAIAPIYTFPQIVAPTGMLRVNGANAMFPRGYLIGAFVTKAIYYVPDVDARPFPDPIPLVAGETSVGVVDVAQTSSGDILFTTGIAIYRLQAPPPGDCNGDGVVSVADLDALRGALAGGALALEAAQTSWGCDANGDGLISGADLLTLGQMLGLRVRAVRAH